MRNPNYIAPIEGELWMTYEKTWHPAWCWLWGHTPCEWDLPYDRFKCPCGRHVVTGWAVAAGLPVSRWWMRLVHRVFDR